MSRGRPPHPDILTPAEWRVLEHLREGQTNAEIAVRLGITPDGVKSHVSNMLAKLNLPDRAALAAWDGSAGATTPRRVFASAWRLPFLAKVATGVAAVLAVGAGTAAAISRFEGGTNDSIPDIHASVQVHSMDVTFASHIDAGTPDQPLHQSSTTRLRWSVAGGTRVESTFTDGDGAGTTETIVATPSGVFSWSSVQPDGQTALQVEELPYPPEAFIPQGIAPNPPGGSLRDIVDKLARGGEARLAGEDVIAGRPAYRLEIQPSGACSPPLATADGTQTFFIDKESFSFLGMTIAAKSDGHVVLSETVRDVRINPAFDPSVFALPLGAQVQPQHDPGTTFVRTDDVCYPSGFTTKVSDTATGSGHLQAPAPTNPQP